MMSPDSPLGPLRVLIADRRGWIARALINVLDPAEWRAAHCHGALDLLRTLPRDEPHIIVLHDDLQDMRMEDLLPRLRAEPGVGSLTPIVVLSTRASRARRLELLRSGATDYMVFPSDPETLLLRLRALAVARREAEGLRRAALIDVETGLYNQAGMARRSREIATDATRRREPLSCVVFAPAPAAPGAVADMSPKLDVVTGLGGIVRRTARLSDAVGRIDQVVVVLAPATSQAGAQRLAERMRQALAAAMGEAAGEIGRSDVVIADRGGASASPTEFPLIRAAYCTVADFARSSVDVPEMIERAVAALVSRANGGDAPAIVGESVPLTPDDADSGAAPDARNR